MSNELSFERIGKKIKEVRLSKQLTQEFISNQADVNTTHISNIENNRVKVSLTVLVAICNALNVTIDYILEREYDNPTSILDKEIMNSISTMSEDKKETLLRISKVL